MMMHSAAALPSDSADSGRFGGNLMYGRGHTGFLYGSAPADQHGSENAVVGGQHACAAAPPSTTTSRPSVRSASNPPTVSSNEPTAMSASGARTSTTTRTPIVNIAEPQARPSAAVRHSSADGQLAMRAAAGGTAAAAAKISNYNYSTPPSQPAMAPPAPTKKTSLHYSPGMRTRGTMSAGAVLLQSGGIAGQGGEGSYLLQNLPPRGPLVPHQQPAFGPFASRSTPGQQYRGDHIAAASTRTPTNSNSCSSNGANVPATTTSNLLMNAQHRPPLLPPRRAEQSYNHGLAAGRPPLQPVKTAPVPRPPVSLANKSQRLTSSSSSTSSTAGSASASSNYNEQTAGVPAGRGMGAQLVTSMGARATESPRVHARVQAIQATKNMNLPPPNYMGIAGGMAQSSQVRSSSLSRASAGMGGGAGGGLFGLLGSPGTGPLGGHGGRAHIRSASQGAPLAPARTHAEQQQTGAGGERCVGAGTSVVASPGLQFRGLQGMTAMTSALSGTPNGSAPQRGLSPAISSRAPVAGATTLLGAPVCGGSASTLSPQAQAGRQANFQTAPQEPGVLQTNPQPLLAHANANQVRQQRMGPAEPQHQRLAPAYSSNMAPTSTAGVRNLLQFQQAGVHAQQVASTATSSSAAVATTGTGRVVAPTPITTHANLHDHECSEKQQEMKTEAEMLSVGAARAATLAVAESTPPGATVTYAYPAAEEQCERGVIDAPSVGGSSSLGSAALFARDREQKNSLSMIPQRALVLADASPPGGAATAGGMLTNYTINHAVGGMRLNGASTDAGATTFHHMQQTSGAVVVAPVHLSSPTASNPSPVQQAQTEAAPSPSALLMQNKTSSEGSPLGSPQLRISYSPKIASNTATTGGVSNPSLARGLFGGNGNGTTNLGPLAATSAAAPSSSSSSNSILTTTKMPIAIAPFNAGAAHNKFVVSTTGSAPSSAVDEARSASDASSLTLRQSQNNKAETMTNVVNHLNQSTRAPAQLQQTEASSGGAAAGHPAPSSNSTTGTAVAGAIGRVSSSSYLPRDDTTGGTRGIRRPATAAGATTAPPARPGGVATTTSTSSTSSAGKTGGMPSSSNKRNTSPRSVKMSVRQASGARRRSPQRRGSETESGSQLSANARKPTRVEAQLGSSSSSSTSRSSTTARNLNDPSGRGKRLTSTLVAGTAAPSRQGAYAAGRPATTTRSSSFAGGGVAAAGGGAGAGASASARPSGCEQTTKQQERQQQQSGAQSLLNASLSSTQHEEQLSAIAEAPPDVLMMGPPEEDEDSEDRTDFLIMDHYMQQQYGLSFHAYSKMQIDEALECIAINLEIMKEKEAFQDLQKLALSHKYAFDVPSTMITEEDVAGEQRAQPDLPDCSTTAAPGGAPTPATPTSATALVQKVLESACALLQFSDLKWASVIGYFSRGMFGARLKRFDVNQVPRSTFARVRAYLLDPAYDEELILETSAILAPVARWVRSAAFYLQLTKHKNFAAAELENGSSSSGGPCFFGGREIENLKANSQIPQFDVNHYREYYEAVKAQMARDSEEAAAAEKPHAEAVTATGAAAGSASTGTLLAGEEVSRDQVVLGGVQHEPEDARARQGSDDVSLSAGNVIQQELQDDHPRRISPQPEQQGVQGDQADAPASIGTTANYTTNHNSEQDRAQTQSQDDPPQQECQPAQVDVGGHAGPHRLRQLSDAQRQQFSSTQKSFQEYQVEKQRLLQLERRFGKDSNYCRFRIDPGEDLLFSPDLNAALTDPTKVHNLTVTREGVGQIMFHGDTDVRGINFREALDLQQGYVLVYPRLQVSAKPPPGTGLNKEATVTLYNCLPPAPVLTVSEAEAYVDRVRQMTLQKGADFLSYDLNTGVWQFQVQHF